MELQAASPISRAGLGSPAHLCPITATGTHCMDERSLLRSTEGACSCITASGETEELAAGPGALGSGKDSVPRVISGKGFVGTLWCI